MKGEEEGSSSSSRRREGREKRDKGKKKGEETKLHERDSRYFIRLTNSHVALVAV